MAGGIRAANRSFEPSKRRNREHVEDCKIKAQVDASRRKLRKRWSRNQGNACDYRQDDGENHVAGRPCQSHQRETVQSPAQLRGVRIHRLTPANEAASEQTGERR